MKNCLYLFFVLFVSVLETSAQELTVNMVSGKQEKYSLKEVRRIVFQDGEIRLSSTSDRLVKAYPYANVEYFNVGGFPSGIVPVWDETGKIAYHNNTKSLYVSFDMKAQKEFREDIRVVISSVEGKILKQVKTPSEAPYPLYAFSVNISDLVPGVYVATLCIGSQQFAFLKFVK